MPTFPRPHGKLFPPPVMQASSTPSSIFVGSESAAAAHAPAACASVFAQIPRGAKAFAIIGGFLLATLAGSSALAQSCAHRFRVTLSDASVICLDRHPLGELTESTGQSLASRLPNNGIYSIHVPRGASCPRSPRLFIPYHAGVDRRRWLAGAQAECEAHAQKLAPDRECKCRRLVVNQVSTLSPEDFERWAGTRTDR